MFLALQIVSWVIVALWIFVLWNTVRYILPTSLYAEENKVKIRWLSLKVSATAVLLALASAFVAINTQRTGGFPVSDVWAYCNAFALRFVFGSVAALLWVTGHEVLDTDDSSR